MWLLLVVVLFLLCSVSADSFWFPLPLPPHNYIINQHHPQSIRIHKHKQQAINMGNGDSKQPVMNAAGEPATSIFQFSVPNIEGQIISLDTFNKSKKAFLIVNVASE